MANHRRQSINKSHSIPYLKSLEKRLGAIQSYLHDIKPSIGVGFKILVGAPLFFLLEGQNKGGVVLGTKNGDNLGGSSYLCLFKNSRTSILLDIYDTSLIIENAFLFGHGLDFISFSSKRYSHHI